MSARGLFFGSVAAALFLLPSCKPTKEKPLKATAVVRAVSALRFGVVEDGSLVLDANLQTFAVTKEDEVARVGDLPAYEPFLSSQEDPWVYAPLFVPRTVHGTASAIALWKGPVAYVYEGTGTWQRRTVQEPPLRIPPRIAAVEAFEIVPAIAPKDIVLPTDFIVDGWVRTSDGSHVAFGQPERTSSLPLSAVARAGQKVAEPVPFDVAATGKWTCHPLPSADGKTYATCSVPDVGEPERRVYRLEGARWVRAVIPFRDTRAPMTIASDGAVWTARAEPARLLRAKDGRTQEIALALPPRIQQATYPPLMFDIENPRLAFTSPITSEPGTLANVSALVARPSGRVFALVREKSIGASVVFRVDDASGVEPPLMKVGSEADQMLEILDAARPSLRWVGHCPNVFVELPSAQAARAGRDLPHKNGLIWTAVEGSLGKRHVFGIVTLAARQGPTTSFEESVSATMELLTKNPAAPPPAFCSLPVLQRIL